MPDTPQAKRRGLTRADVAAVLEDYPSPAKAVNHTKRDVAPSTSTTTPPSAKSAP